jgi:hypothetical protein
MRLRGRYKYIGVRVEDQVLLDKRTILYTCIYRCAYR